MSDHSPVIVSVLVTVYNRKAFLPDCLSSILASEFRDFEVIVVDDASTDGSQDISRDFTLQDHRVKFFENPNNLGDYPNRNRAAALASGEYLKFVDADDIIYPHSLGLMVNAMRINPESALGLSWNIIDPDRPYPFASSPRETLSAHFLNVSRFGVGPSASIIRRDAFLDVGGFAETQFVGDTDLWFRLAEHWPMVSLPPALVWWRRHEDQQMTLEHKDLDVLNRRFEIEKSWLARTTLLTDAEKTTAARRINTRHARRLISLAVREGRMADAMRLWKESGLSTLQGANALLS